MIWRPAGLLAILLPLVSAAASTGFKADFNERGLAVLSLNGTPLLHSGKPRTRVILFGSESGLEKGETDGRSRFDADTRRLEIDYEWGTVACRYEVDEQGWFIVIVSIENTSPRPVAEWTFDLLQFAFPTLPEGEPWQRGYEFSADNVDNIAHLRVPLKGAAFLFCLDDLASPARIAFPPPHDGSIRSARLSSAIWSSPDDPVIWPGETRTFRLSFRPLPVENSLESVLSDLLVAFRQKHPHTLAWKDRRPVGMLALASNAHRSPSNPGGWLNEPRLNAGDSKRFRRLMLERADHTIEILKKMDAQGMIFWNLESERIPRLSYIGDPRLLKKFAPEMDAIADEFFARFQKAGIRTGLCIRPSRIDTSIDESDWRHEHMGFDVTAILADKIRHAQERWGCTLFYIDTNIHSFFQHDRTVESRPFDVAILKELHRQFPDVLIFPEIPVMAYWAVSAPYRELRPHTSGGHAQTPGFVRQIWPSAFSLINPIDGPIIERTAELREGIRQGDIMLFPCWFDNPVNDLVRKLYEKAP